MRQALPPLDVSALVRIADFCHSMNSMRSRVIKLLPAALYLAAGVSVVWLWKLSSTSSPTSTLFRRGYFLIDVLLGAAMTIQATAASARGSSWVSKFVLAVGIFILLVGVGMAYSWISGK